VFAPNHKLRRAVTSLAIGNVGKRQEAATRGHTNDGSATGRCCDATHATQKPRSRDTSRIAWAKLIARVGEEFPLECPACGGASRLIAFITEPGPIWKILTNLGEPLEPPPVSPARGPPSDWGALVQVHDDRDVFQSSSASCPRSTSTASDHCHMPGHDKAAGPPDSERLRAQTRKPPRRTGEAGGRGKAWCGPGDRSTRLTSHSSVR